MKYEFVFNNNITNEVLAHNRLFHLEKMNFGTDYRIDIVDNTGFIYTENTSYTQFKKVVNTTHTLDEQMNEWANYILNQYNICDICGNLELIIELGDYDLETFPQLKGKKVCDKCRTNVYNEYLNKLVEEDKEEQLKNNNIMKEKGYKYVYDFWIHSCSGDDFQVDIYTEEKLTKAEIKVEMNKLEKEYSADLVEEPSCDKL